MSDFFGLKDRVSCGFVASSPPVLPYSVMACGWKLVEIKVRMGCCNVYVNVTLKKKTRGIE